MSLTHWLVVIVIALLLFGRGKISEMMGDLAKGIKSFKKGMAEDDEAFIPKRTEEYEVIENEPPKPVAAKKKAPAKRATKAKG
jgi:sec-independent protein translocase protein TatA